jgi:hypothetical protein
MHLMLMVFSGALMWSLVRKHDLALAASFFAVLAGSWQGAMLLEYTLFHRGSMTIAQYVDMIPGWYSILHVIWMLPVTGVLCCWAVKAAWRYIGLPPEIVKPCVV